MRLQAIQKEIEKTQEEIGKYKEKIKALKQRKIDEENAQIIKIVRASNLSVERLKEILMPKKNKEEETNV